MILTILNTIAIVYLFFKHAGFYVSLRKDKTFEGTFVAYHITLWKKTSQYSSNGVYALIIPIKNKKKVEKQEEIRKMISTYSDQQKLQNLTAMFSWLKTWEEVKQFENDYSVVDRKIVENLVSGFARNNKS